MEYSHPHAVEGHKTSLELFDKVESDRSVVSIDYEDYRPTTPLAKNTPIVFNINSTTDYINLKKTKLYLKVKITKANGDAVGLTDKVAFINMPLHTLFRQVDLELQHQNLTTGVSSCYPYKAMLDTLLKSTDGRSLGSELFYKDRGGFLDDVDFIGNPGMLGRWAFTMKGQECELEGPLMIDIMNQNRLLLNGISINLRLYPNTDAFALMRSGEDAYKYEITEAVLRLSHHRMNAGLLAGHDTMLTTTPALYPYVTTEIKTFSISAGSYTWSTENVFNNNVPKRMYCTIVSGAAYSGDFAKNPFNFQHFDVNFLGFYVQGQSRPGPPFQPNFANEQALTPYMSIATLHPDMDINRVEYVGGYAIYCFDLQEEEGHHAIPQGHTRLILKMSKALPESVTLIVYGEFPSVMEIDALRNIKVYP